MVLTPTFLVPISRLQNDIFTTIFSNHIMQKRIPILLGTTAGQRSSSWTLAKVVSTLASALEPHISVWPGWLDVTNCAPETSSRSRVRTMKMMTTATMINVVTIPIRAPSIGVIWNTTAWVVGPTKPDRLSTALPTLLQ